MVDTIRTKAEILTDIVSGAVGGTSAQDIRNLFLSLIMPMGQIYENGNVVETTIVTPGTFVASTVPTCSFSTPTERISGSPDFDMPVAGRLRYLGTTPIHIHIACSVSMVASGNNKTLAFRLARDGVTDIASQIERRISTGADIGSAALHLITTLTTNQYIELYVANETDTVNVTITDMNLQIVGGLMS